MSFALHARGVRSSARPIAQRHKALKSCVTSYSWLTRTSYRLLYEELARRHAIGEDAPSANLLAALAEIEAAREPYLRALRAFAEMRRGQKRRGIRRPLRADAHALDELLTLGVPRTAIHPEFPGFPSFCVGILGVPSSKSVVWSIALCTRSAGSQPAPDVVCAPGFARRRARR